MTEKHMRKMSAEFGQGICVPSAFDAVSERFKVPREIYELSARAWASQRNGPEVDNTALYERLLGSIGLSLAEVDMGYVNTLDEFAKVMDKMAQTGRGVLRVVAKSGHEIGVIAKRKQEFELVGQVESRTMRYKKHGDVNYLFGILDKTRPDFYNYMILPKER